MISKRLAVFISLVCNLIFAFGGLIALVGSMGDFSSGGVVASFLAILVIAYVLFVLVAIFLTDRFVRDIDPISAVKIVIGPVLVLLAIIVLVSFLNVLVTRLLVIR